MLDRHTTVHNATVCVDFVEKDTFTGISFVENVPKNCFLFAFLKLFIYWHIVFYTSKKIWGEGGEAQAPSAPPPATGLKMQLDTLVHSTFRSHVHKDPQ